MFTLTVSRFGTQAEVPTQVLDPHYTQEGRVTCITKLDELCKKVDALLERSGPPQRFLSIKSAAKCADLSEDSIRRMIERRDLIAHRPAGGLY